MTYSTNSIQTLALKAWIALIVLTPSIASAGSNPFEKGADGVFGFLTGPISTSLMGIAFVAIVAAIQMGKATWGALANLCLLILAIFSIQWILETIASVAK